MNGQNQNGYYNYNNQNANHYGQVPNNYNMNPYQQNQVNSNYYYPQQQYPNYQYPQQNVYNQNRQVYNQNNFPRQNYNPYQFQNQNLNNNTNKNIPNMNNNNTINTQNKFDNLNKIQNIDAESQKKVEEIKNIILNNQKNSKEIQPLNEVKTDEVQNNNIDDVEEIEIIDDEPIQNNEETKDTKEIENNDKKGENKPKKVREFSVLERYGEDITKKEYVTNPAIAREDEIGKLILVLLTPDKSACLVGKPGIGKTAIVEGLAYRIIRNDVPNILKGYSIYNIATSSLLGESISDGERESRIQLLVNEVMEADKVILFIDEIHTLMGAGAKDGSALDFANILKPALARGNVKLIGATTSDEYERYMIRDRAFIRRFEKIEVAEPDIPTTVKILMGSYPRIEKQTGVKLAYTEYVKQQLMTFIVEMTSEYKRFYEVSSRYPDISLALLSKAFSFAMYENSNEVRLRHFWMAVCTCESIYPDSRAKEIERFKEVFKDMIKEENLDVNEPINI